MVDNQIQQNKPVTSLLQLTVNLIVNGLAVFIASMVLAGVVVENFGAAILVAVMLGIVNTFVRPVLIVLTLPITVVTLGLFLLVLNAVMILLVSYVVPGFMVDSFWWALIFSIVLSLVSSFLNLLQKK